MSWYGVTTTIAFALLTVRLSVSVLPRQTLSAVKLAPTPVAYVPALIPPTLTFNNVATPELFVEALPADAPLIVKLMVFPLIPALHASVAVRFTVPPKVPVAALATRLDATWALTVINSTPLLPAWAASPGYEAETVIVPAAAPVKFTVHAL